MNTTCEINLLPFCSQDSGGRFSLNTPFAISGRLCATDGSIIVSVPTDAPDAERNIPRTALRNFDGWDAATDWQPWPAAEYNMALGPCHACKGTGAAHHRTCENCDGDGDIICGECDQEYECPDCDGEGKILCGKCATCGGKKEIVQQKSIRVCGLLVSYQYDQKIRDLPGVECAASDERILFRFAGDGRGIVMPLCE